MPSPPKFPLAPFLAMLGGLIAAIILSAGFTSWSITIHSRQACPEMSVLASARGTSTPWEKTVSREYADLYRLRCR
jgi:hypothetical protein